MPSYVPCKKNDSNGYIFYISLVSQASPRIFQVNPTLAAGDVKITIDDGAPANLGTLPAVDADFTKRVKVVLSQAETNGDNLTIVFSDASGAEWCDVTVNIQTSAQTLDIVDTVVDGIQTDLSNVTDGLGALKALIDTLQTTVTKLDDTVEDDGGTFRFTENALEEAPSGTGGDATAANQAKILQVLAGKWEITGNQLIMYDSDETTPLYTFDLTNIAGDPSSVRVFKRDPV